MGIFNSAKTLLTTTPKSAAIQLNDNDNDNDNDNYNDNDNDNDPGIYDTQFRCCLPHCSIALDCYGGLNCLGFSSR